MKQILLVDDHAIVRRGMMQILSESLPGASFGEAGSAAEALDVLAKKPWDLALIDLNIPGRDGLSLLEEIGSLYPRLPTLVVSAYSEEEFAVRCLRLGAGGYLTKASAPDELAVAVKKVLAGGKYVTAALAEKLADIMKDTPARASQLAALDRLASFMRLESGGTPSAKAAGVVLDVVAGRAPA